MHELKVVALWTYTLQPATAAELGIDGLARMGDSVAVLGVETKALDIFRIQAFVGPTSESCRSNDQFSLLSARGSGAGRSRS